MHCAVATISLWLSVSEQADNAVIIADVAVAYRHVFLAVRTQF